MSVEWSEALPVLEAVHRTSRRLDASPYIGVRQNDINEELGREPDDLATSNTLYYLVEAGYLRETLTGDQLPGPAACALAPLGLQVVAGWPKGAGDALLGSLVEEIGPAHGDGRHRGRALGT